MRQELKNLANPIAIVVAGALIAVSIFLVGNMNPSAGGVAGGGGTPTTAFDKNAPAVTGEDHIRGSANAPVVIVEYIDLECPFCKQFDSTMKQVLAASPDKVAWVIRNFPLQQLHPNAPRLALGAECVASLGGNDAYWSFLDSVFVQAPINTFFDMTKLTSTATSVGVNGGEFDACVASGKFQDKITAELNDAINAGGQGTPYSVVLLKKALSQSGRKAIAELEAKYQTQGVSLPISADGKRISMGGSQPLEVVKTVVEIATK